ncbi:MAG: isochorismatase family protein [Syntrophorhabdales bacterium]|jgi:nicotinamidase/pyrazinamidase
MQEKWGALVVDVQGDFTTWKKGALAAPDTGEDYVRDVERATRRLKEAGVVILGSQDWHPPNHISFASNHPGKQPFESIIINGRTQVLWPPHCVQGTEQARVLIDNSLFLTIVRKAQNPGRDGYSAFQDDGGERTELHAILGRNGVERLLVYGIATDYCVRATAIDGVAAGYQVTVVRGLCRGIAPETTLQALDEMRQRGVRIVETPEEAAGEVGSPKAR